MRRELVRAMSDFEPGDFEGAGVEIHADGLAWLHGVVERAVDGDFGRMIWRAPGSEAKVPGGAAPAGNAFLNHFSLKNLRGGMIQKAVRHGRDSTGISHSEKQSGQIGPALFAGLGVSGCDKSGHRNGDNHRRQ